jgi:hypothetical protein
VTKYPAKASNRHVLLALSSCVLLSACGSEATEDYCRDHYLFHEEHRADTALLDIVVTDAGSLSAKLVVPIRIFDQANARRESVFDALRDSTSIYSMAEASGCSQTDSAVAEQSDTITATYQSQCTAGTDLNQVNVSLFDLLPELDEVEVTINTDATAKNFAISRQCSAAIFRIKNQ